MSETTPRPWHLEEDEYGRVPAILAKQGPVEVCLARAHSLPDAELIVHAVNNIDRFTAERDRMANPTDAMLDAFLIATDQFAAAWPPTYEEGTMIDPGLDQEDADGFNEEARTTLRRGWAAALAALRVPDAESKGSS